MMTCYGSFTSLPRSKLACAWLKLLCSCGFLSFLQFDGVSKCTRSTCLLLESKLRYCFSSVEQTSPMTRSSFRSRDAPNKLAAERRLL